jgi:hypothetical protein
MYFINGGSHWLKCRKGFRPEKLEEDPVLGTKKVPANYQYCSSFRIGESKEGNCGYDAFYWEPKDQKNLFKFMKKVSDNG